MFREKTLERKYIDIGLCYAHVWATVLCITYGMCDGSGFMYLNNIREYNLLVCSQTIIIDFHTVINFITERKTNYVII